MSKATDSFRALHVFNPHGFYGWEERCPVQVEFPQVALTYRTQTTGRGYQPAAWVVLYLVGPGQQVPTDPGGHWRNNGRKTFNIYGRDDKPVKLAEAQAWVESLHGPREWARDPYGGYGEAGFVKARVAALKAAVADG